MYITSYTIYFANRVVLITALTGYFTNVLKLLIMNVNNSFVCVNALKGLVFNQVDGKVDKDTYRVVLRDAIDGYRKNEAGERVATKVCSYLVPAKVFRAQVFSRLPLLAEMYDKTLKQAKADFAEKVATNTAKAEDEDDVIKDVIDNFLDTLQLFLTDGSITLQLDFHAAGEIETLADGSTVEHQMDKFNVSMKDIAYGPAGAEAAEYAVELRAKKAKDRMAAILDLL